MRLLIITQKVDRDDPILGFFHRWILEFAQHADVITVICLQEGSHQLPANVNILSLGKERKVSRTAYISNFYSYIWKQRKNYDSVFVHMNPIYIILGGFLWRLLGKRISLWYTHRQVDLKLRIAEIFVSVIFTASEESFGLKSDKVVVVGHGIDTVLFKCDSPLQFGVQLHLVHVGRITKIKNCDVLIEALHILNSELSIECDVTFIGEPITKADYLYKKDIEMLIVKFDLESKVIFAGSVKNHEISHIYCQSNLSVNLTPTGGVDKSVLESMSCGIPVLTSNQAFKGYFGPYANILLFEEGNAYDLARKIKAIFQGQQSNAMSEYLREVAVKRASVEVLIRQLIEKMP